MLQEKIEIDLEKGDTILTGRFKNHKVIVKDIGKDPMTGGPTVNGREILKVRIEKLVKKKSEVKGESNMQMREKVEHYLNEYQYHNNSERITLSKPLKAYNMKLKKEMVIPAGNHIVWNITTGADSDYTKFYWEEKKLDGFSVLHQEIYGSKVEIWRDGKWTTGRGY